MKRGEKKPKHSLKQHICSSFTRTKPEVMKYQYYPSTGVWIKKEKKRKIPHEILVLTAKIYTLKTVK